MNGLSSASLQARIVDVSQRMGTQTFLRLLTADGVTIEMSYATMVQQAFVWAGLYAARGLKPGSRVVLLLPHSADLYTAFLGALLSYHLPAILSPPSQKLSPSRFRDMLQGILPATTPDAIIVGGDLDIAFAVAEDVTIIRTADAMGATGLQTLAISSQDRSDEVAFLQYSSGTTGLKKGLAISHGACLRQVDHYAAAIGLSPADSIVSWLPLYHDMGFVACWLLPLLTGTPVTAMSAFDWIARPSSLIRAIRDHRPTLCWMPNFAFAHLARISTARDIRADDFSSVRALINCSEPIRHDTHERFLAAFATAGMRPEKLATCYAMAETTFAITSSSIGSPPASTGVDPATLAAGQAISRGPMTLVSSGRAIAGTSVRVTGPEGASLPEGMVGELRVTSASLMTGYLRTSEHTGAAIAGRELATGDLGFILGGEVYVLGRDDDLIISAGRNLFPQDIEAAAETVAGTIPGRAVAFGVEDERSGTTHVVVVAESPVTDAGARVALERAIAAEIAATLDTAPHVVKVVERGRLLKSTSGKLSRRANREAYLADLKTLGPEHPASTSSPPSDGSLLAFARSAVAGSLSGAPPGDEESLIMSGRLDSFGLMSLLLTLEHRFGDRIPTPNVIGFHRFDSIRALSELLAEVEQGLQIQSRDMTYAARDTKVEAIERSSLEIDMLILGSSTSFALPCWIGEEFGLTPFNFAVNSASIADIYCLLRFALARQPAIRRLVVGLDVFAFKDRGAGTLDSRSILMPEVTQYLLSEDRRALADQGDELRGQAQHSQIHRQRLAEWNPGMWFSFDRQTGDLIINAQPEAGSARTWEKDIMAKQHELFMIFNGFEHLCPRQSTYLRAIVATAADAGIFIDFVVMPLHPLVQDFVAGKTPYLARRRDIAALIEGLNAPHVRLHDFPSPDTFGGIDEDFEDAYHIGAVNAECLLRHVLSHSIEQA